jgi:hypothetical protein
MIESKFSRNVHLPPWGTALGVMPAVGSIGRWGQVPAVVPHSTRFPIATAHGGWSPSAAAHGGKALAPWATAAAPRLYKGSSPCRRPPHSSPTPPTLRLSILRSTSELCF